VQEKGGGNSRGKDKRMMGRGWGKVCFLYRAKRP